MAALTPSPPASATPLHFQGAAQLARRIAAGDISSRALLEAMLARVAKYNPALNAIILLRADEARARADAADAAQAAGQSWGPLHGVPMTVKECFDWTGTPSTFGHPERATHRARHDAAVIERLEAAGAIVFGKTNVPKDLSDWQSFNAVYGVTVNPWNAAHSPGGSSGGSAAALAAGLTALEVGSDVGGSIRVPAHFSGVYGHRPTYGIVPVRGHALTEGAPPDDINVVGPLARTPEDLDLAMRLLAGADGPQARGWKLDLPEAKHATLSGWRVALVTGDPDYPVDTDTRDAVLAVADTLRRAGASVTLDPALPLPSREYHELYIALLRGSTAGRRSAKEIAAMKSQAAALAPEDHGYEALMLRGLTQDHREWLEQNARRTRLRADWEAFFGRYDLLVTPMTPTPAFPHIHDTPKPAQRLMVDGVSMPMSNTYFWIGLSAVAYLPATVIPAGQSRVGSTAGLPIGLQVLGPEYGDLSCIALARQLETAHRGFQPPPGYD